MYIEPCHAQEQLNSILTSGWDVLDSKKACGYFNAAWLEHNSKECIKEASDGRLHGISAAAIEQTGSCLCLLISAALAPIQTSMHVPHAAICLTCLAAMPLFSINAGCGQSHLRLFHVASCLLVPFSTWTTR